MYRTPESYTRYPTESSAIAAKTQGQRVADAKARWDELLNELTALRTSHCPRGTQGYGWAEACLEDANMSVLMLLDEVQSGIKAYAIEE